MNDDALADFPEIDTADMPDTGRDDAPDPVVDAPDEAPPASGDDDPLADAPPADPAAALPAYRREAIAARETQALMGRLDRLEQLLRERPSAAPPGVVPAGAELTPEQKAVQEKFYTLFPGAKGLFEKADQILRAADVVGSGGGA